MIFFVTGASGSGKTACMPDLARLLPSAEVRDFDSLGVPPNADKVWRQQSTEEWLRRGMELARDGRDLVVCGTAVLGEILACPSAPEAGPIAACLLDCGDVLRVERLRERGTHGCTQDMLSWAAWLRLHAADPRWRPDVVREGGAPGMRWDRWEGWTGGDPRWRCPVIDSTGLSLPEVAVALAEWVSAARRGEPPGPLDRPPIVGFDPAREALIDCTRWTKRRADMPAAVVACFFSEVLADLQKRGRLRPVHAMRSELGENVVHALEHEGREVAVFHPGIGGPLAAGFLEEVIALGGERFIACGGAGVLDQGFAVGHVLVPTAAVRDEGTSYHYLAPSRTVAAAPAALAAIERTLQRRGVAYRLATTWTTDAFYRETPARIGWRRAEGCVTVEMEAATFFAVAQFRGKPFGQLLYAGDDLSGSAWDHRGWETHSGRERLFWLAVEAALELAGQDCPATASAASPG
jgi:uridine phosphorylase